MRELINKIGTFCVNRLAELVGIIIVLASIFIFASLVTYSPEDPNFIFPENTLIKNLMGSKGSFISDLLFQSFGLVSLLIPFTFFFTGLSVAISKKFLSIIENSFFIILYILLACLFFSAFGEDSYWLIINGNNGFIGNIYNETYILNLVKSSENFSYYILITLILKKAASIIPLDEFPTTASTFFMHMYNTTFDACLHVKLFCLSAI